MNCIKKDLKLTAIDFCEEAISIMRERDKDLEGLQILVMDVRNLSMFPDHAFDCIVDKAVSMPSS